MAFHYTRTPWTQHLLSGTVLLLAVALGATDTFASAWSHCVARVDGWVLLTGGLVGLHTLVYYPVCLAFHYVDTHDKPDFIARYRIQRSKRKHPNLPKTLGVLFRNQFLILPPLLLLLGEVLFWRGWTVEAELPTLGRFLLELVGQAVCAALIFYASHRMLHGKWWMVRVHRVHHEFRTTTAWASEYAHPFEFIVGNFLTMVGGALLLAPHLLSMYMFATLGLLTILSHHCGYALPWTSWAVPHDWHHYRFNEIFGTTGFIDKVMGTDKDFRDLKDGDIR
ncbi:MAG: hypothetical protein GWP91_14845 [Rhodobacterales bacterium]|nr:hypothetical protein [Rhodobacterales bacterium]